MVEGRVGTIGVAKVTGRCSRMSRTRTSAWTSREPRELTQSAHRGSATQANAPVISNAVRITGECGQAYRTIKGKSLGQSHHLLSIALVFVYAKYRRRCCAHHDPITLQC